MSKYTSKKSFEESGNVDRRFLAQYVFKKLNRKVKKYHVDAVISFLFDELIVDLLNGKIITIGKFGKLALKQMQPVKHWNYITQKFAISKSRKKMRFQLHRNVRSFLIKNLDIAKTYGDE